MRPQVVLSTTNAGKVAEIRDAIGDLFELVDRPAELAPVEEDAPDLVGNARLKAESIALATGVRALADDTGLEVDALDGRPGVRSARWAGPAEDPIANMAKLLADLDGVTDRAARFRTVLVLSDPQAPAGASGEIVAHGVVEGIITEKQRGDNGFGYDPVFVPAGHESTFAEMSFADKQAISHRARALSALRSAIEQELGMHTPN